MSPPPLPALVLFVADVSGMARFYGQLAGMTKVHADEEHVVLEGHGLQLVLHKLRGEPAVEQPPEPREDCYLKLCLPVASLAAARAAAPALGGRLGPVEREWEARGFRACDGVDPEGNVYQLRERAP
ncbi:VOC family protein [Pelomonas sp. SE-A7]|uniref:VOC family protein n=1 Tax=Pelomonas sp. SE-A7 TaxID=3054953 RepID=UPI00259C88D9|nr:VOC family protein [Pelomonas sp. SE-A7]MDM4766591.1 VOC family protein [Pelomonas sp. SE-A7]